LSFGAEVFGVTGATSKPRTVTISNPKSAARPATIATLSIGDADSDDFTVEVPDDCSGTALAPGEKCSVEVTFTPTRLGAISSRLTVTDSSGHSGKPVALKGSGVRGALQFLPHTLSFPKTQRGTFSAPQLVTLSNKNPVALDISSITPESGFTAESNCLGTLAAGGTCEVSVTFSPPAAKNSKGSKMTGALILTNDAAASPQKVQLSGVEFGTAPPPTPTSSPAPTPSATPTPATPTPTPIPTATPAPTAIAVSTGTPTPAPTSTPTSTPSP